MEICCSSTVSRWNSNLEVLIFVREENRRTRKKTPGAGTRHNNKLKPHVTPGPGIDTLILRHLNKVHSFIHRPRATLVGGESSHHCTIPAPLRRCCETLMCYNFKMGCGALLLISHYLCLMSAARCKQ